MRKGIRIETQGDGPHCGVGTKIIDLESGTEIKHVAEIHIHIVPNDVVRAEVLILPTEISVEAQADIEEKPEATVTQAKNDEPKLPSGKDCIKVITAGSAPNLEAARKADKS